VPVVEPVSELLAGAPGRVRSGVRLALRAFEWSSFPRPFSRLPPDRRLAHLARMENGRGSLRRSLFLLLKGLACVAYARDSRVATAVGSEARCVLKEGAAPPGPAQRLDPAQLEPREELESCDVVVVGSGAGGAAAARTLAEAGLSVIVVEEGAYHDAATYPDDPLRALSELYRDAGLTACEGSPVIPMPVGRCVGGTTVINSGTCFRAPADVLLRWRDELGIAWATELDGDFEALERDLAVTPVDPARAGRNAALCRAGAEAIGAANEPLRRNAGDTVCCGTCPMGCRLDAKQAAHVSELPRAAERGALVRAGVKAERVLVSGGRAAGVSCRRGGGRYEVRSRAVVLAAGALGTPELLLSQGLGGGSGALGRHLHIHPACWVGARFDEPVRGWEGVMQSWHVGEWHDRGLFLEATFTPLAFGAHWLRGVGAELEERLLAYDRLAIIGVHLSDRSEGRVVVRGGRTRVRYRLTGDDASRIAFGIARAADIHFAAGAREVYPQVGRLGPLEPGQQVERVERGGVRPRDLRLEAFHPMGTARMGSDPQRCVVAPNGELHDAAGLFIADASLFPTSLRVNPMLTIMACARRIARGVAEQLA
jgi:choline dehydrogenase-like flavoprotein